LEEPFVDRECRHLREEGAGITCPQERDQVGEFGGMAFELVEQILHPPDEDPGVPQVATLVEVALGRSGVGLLDEAVYLERLGSPCARIERFAAADVA